MTTRLSTDYTKLNLEAIEPVLRVFLVFEGWSCRTGHSYLISVMKGQMFVACVLVLVVYICQQPEPTEARRRGRGNLLSAILTLFNSCNLSPDEGEHCSGHRTSTRWYYSGRSDRCKRFRFHGCDGNLNNFRSRRRCERYCSHRGRHDSRSYESRSMEESSFERRSEQRSERQRPPPPSVWNDTTSSSREYDEMEGDDNREVE